MKLPRRELIIYGAALVGVGAASAIRFALDPVLGEHMLFSVYFLAVFIAAWMGGIRPAIITALFSSFLANYLFSEPRGHFLISNAEQLSSLIVFNAVSLLIAILCEVSLKSRARAAPPNNRRTISSLSSRTNCGTLWRSFTIRIWPSKAELRRPGWDVLKLSTARCNNSIK